MRHSERQHLLRLLDCVSRWATAELISGLLQNGELFSALAAGATLDELVGKSSLTHRQTASLLCSLEVEDVVRRANGMYRLTDFGLSLPSLRGWMDLFVRGYGDYFHRARELWRGELGPDLRNMLEVGLASAGMSHHDAIPLVISLIESTNPAGSHVIDLGCADGAFLVALCEHRPELTGVGVEQDPHLAGQARRNVEAHGLRDRIQVVEAAAQDYVPETMPDFLVFAFVLQEIVGQIGDDGAVELLRLVGERFRSARILVVEVDGAGREDLDLMRGDPHRRGYYNYYYLLHDLTQQRLLAFDEWRRLFRKAGLRVELEQPCDPTVDPTGLTAGFALTAGP
jgi:2-ketoarginine methyltransferase